ncbi:MAG: zinc-ribbon domain-containing protein [Candidatus Hodarchaeota archaeon]
MSKYCSKCGARITEDSIFCEYCGNKLKGQISSYMNDSPFPKESTGKPTFSATSRTTPPPPSYISHYRPYRRSSSSQGIKWIFIGIFFILLIGFAAIVFFGLIVLPFPFNQMMNQHDYIGDKTFSIDKLVNGSLNVDLEVYNSLGSVNIEIADISNLFEAQISVYAREGHRLRDANNFEKDSFEDRQFIFFNSNSGSDWENPYMYDLEITISNQATIALNIEVSTGTISIVVQNTTISSLFLETSTGNINAEFKEVFFNASDSYFLHTSTGSITTTFNNVNYSSNEVEWILDTSTGSIDLNLIQELVIENTLVHFDVGASTGKIDFYHLVNVTIGIQIYADVSTGSISTPSYSTDDEYNYKSENYNNAPMKFDISMQTSTGSINILSSL